MGASKRGTSPITGAATRDGMVGYRNCRNTLEGGLERQEGRPEDKGEKFAADYNFSVS